MMAECYKISWAEIDCKINTNSLSIATINTRSLKKRFQELVGHLKTLKHRITFIIITESWLTEESDHALEIDGYSSMSSHRNGTGGGIKIYYLSSISATAMDDVSCNHLFCESLFMKCRVPGYGNLIVGGVYRPPSGNNDSFISYMNDTLSSLNNSRCLIGGDFNYNTLNPNNTVNDYIDIMTSYGYNNGISLNTYVSPISNNDTSCLDHTWNNIDETGHNFVVYPNLADHYFVLSTFDKNISKVPIKVRFRDFSHDNISIFKNNLVNEFRNYNASFYDVNSATDYLIIFLKKILDKYFPIKSKLLTQKRLKAPWLNKEILKCIRKKHVWYRKWKNNEITSESYKKYCKILYHILKLAEESYMTKKLDSLGNNSKKNWKILNNLLKKKSKAISDNFFIEGVYVNDPEIICEKFNDYFLDHPQQIQNNISPSNSDYLSLIPRSENTLSFDPTNHDEVFAVISSLKNNCNIYDIPTNFLKTCANELSGHLANLFNLCLSKKQFPNAFKLAKINPIFKKGLQTDISNFRPIAILNNLSKIFDNLIFARISTCFETLDVLSENQFGFRKKKNTELAALTLVNRTLPAITNNKYALCIFLDFSACFDTICRDIFLKKLLLYGICPNSVDFLKSYLNDRRQQVIYNGKSSNESIQNLGVIQGSKNGPKFFDIYSNDLNYLCFPDENICYADDTCLIYHDDDLKNLINKANSRLKIILDWCKYNKLAINPSKSEYLIITNKTLDFEPELFLGTEIIQRKNCVKYLGLHIDSDLKFSSHLYHIKTKLSRFAGVSFRLKNHFNVRTAKNYYYSCVYSVLTYCISTWGGSLLNGRRGDGIANKQKKVVTNLFSKHYPNSSCIFKEMKILKVFDLYKFHCAVHMFKIIQQNSNEYIRDAVNLIPASHNYHTRNRDRLRTPFPRVEAVRFNFEYQFIEIWENIPISIRNSISLKTFKKLLSSHFIDMY